jgi:hypothetical protein
LNQIRKLCAALPDGIGLLMLFLNRIGITCIELEEIIPLKKQIVSPRSFGIPVSDLVSLEEAVSLYISRVAEKLRRQQSYAGAVYVVIRASPKHRDRSRLRLGNVAQSSGCESCPGNC